MAIQKEKVPALPEPKFVSERLNEQEYAQEVEMDAFCIDNESMFTETASTCVVIAGVKTDDEGNSTHLLAHLSSQPEEDPAIVTGLFEELDSRVKDGNTRVWLLGASLVDTPEVVLDTTPERSLIERAAEQYAQNHPGFDFTARWSDKNMNVDVGISSSGEVTVRDYPRY